MNCPNCGAVVKEGKFCNYCGAKLPDDTKRVEVNINKRIEDVAEIKRAEYETKESELHQKKVNAQFRARKVRRWSCLIALAICIVLVLIAIPNKIVSTGQAASTFIAIIGGIPLLGYIIYLLITGKW